MAEPTLFDEASLALIASGGAGKDGKVYSVKPVPEYGPEKVTNGDFATDSNWTKGNGATISGGKANIIGDGSTYVSITQNSVFTTGRKYRVSADVEINSGLGLKFQDGATNENIGFATSSGTYVFDFIAGSNTSLAVGRRTGNTAFNSSVDNISVKEISNDGDFTFSRGSNLAATRVGPDGLIEKGRENLLLQSNQFDTTWGNTNITVAGGQSDRNGGSNAWKFDINGGTAAQNIRQAVSNSGVATFSIYLKAGTLNWSLVQVLDGGSNPAAYFDLQNGAVGNITGGAIDASIEAAGNGYYRCSVQANGNITQARIYPATTDNNITQSSGYIFGQDAQVEIGLAATDYIESGATTGKAELLEDEPRFDYSGGATCPSLLLEPSRTNQVQNSEYYESYALSSLSISSNAAVSPEGLQNAAELIESSSNDNHFVRIPNLSWTSGTDVVFSIYLKENTRRYARLRFDNSGSNTRAWLDLRTGETTFIDAGAENGVCTSVDYGNGWFKYDFKITAQNTGTGSVQIFTQSVESVTGSLQTTYQGDGTSGIYVWGAQVETGSYATSYIPTYGSSQTRAEDVCGGAGDASTFNSTEGVLYAEIAALANDGTNREISINNGTTTDRVQILCTPTDNQIYIFYKAQNGATQFTMTETLTDATQFNKIAFKWKANDFALWVNGTETDTISSGVTSNANALTKIDFDQFNGGTNFYGKTKQVLVFKEALSDTELIKLTTI